MSVHENRKGSLVITATTDAESIGDNKVICQSIEIPNATLDAGGTSLIKSITVSDETTTGPAIDIIFAAHNTAITQDEGKAVGEDVADLDGTISKFLGHVSIAASDYTDLFDAKLGTKTGIDLAVTAAAGSTSIYMHIINRSGSNWTAAETNDLKVTVGFEY